MAVSTITGKGLNANARRPNVQPLIINGNMQVAQRSTSETGKTASGYYTCDRFKLNVSSLGTWTIAQETLTSGNAFADGFQKAFRIDCTTADASPGSGDYLLVNYSLEGQDVQCFKKGTANAKKMTLSFWVKSNKTGTAQVNVRDIDNDRMCSGTYTIAAADTWEHKIINIASDSSGDFDIDNAESLRIQFWLDAGSNYTSGAVPTSWEATATADLSVNDLALGDNTANDWAITGLQLEVGEYDSNTLPDFQHESYAENLVRCQRYYYKLAAADDEYFGTGNVDGSNSAQILIHFPITMRTAPSAVETTGTGSHYTIRVVSNVDCDAVPIFGNHSNKVAQLDFKKSSHGLTSTDAAFGRSNNASSYLAWSADL